MNCFNCSKYLQEAIDSVYAQTYADWEIIFWDNASTDNSAEIAKSYDKKLRYFRGEKNIPLGNARNLAIEMVRGEYVAFLDCDDIWMPQKLEKQVKLFETQSDVMLVYSDSYLIDSEGNTIRTAFETEEPYKGQVFDELLCRYNFIPLLTAMIRKEVFDKVGLFNPAYKMAEEYDLFLRIAHLFSIDYVESPMAKYRIHDGNFSRNLDIGIKEELEILNKWIRESSALTKEDVKKVKIKKVKRYAALYLYYFVKYTHLPKRFAKFY
ncbi:MAG: glycosyltransferase [Methanosarcinaceae archaeon]|nr:glycosyltransferase [Methanosarcinaceae archaeon]